MTHPASDPGTVTAPIPTLGPTPGRTGRYLYAISRGVDADRLAEVPALAGGRLETVEHRGLVAVVSTVDLEEYGEQGLRRNLERLDWLEQVARGHDTVVRAVAEVAPTAPARLATICLDDDGVRARLEEWGAQVGEVLDRIEGRMEWSVKVVAPPRPTASTRSDAAPGSAGTSGPASGGSPAPGAGAAYLRRKKEETAARERAEADVHETAERVHQALVGLAVASRRLPPQDPSLTGLEGTMVHNGAYLVEESRGGEVAALVQQLGEAYDGVRVSASGPWPPYSFATLEQP